MGKSEPRRVRVEPGIFKRPDGKLEIGWRDAAGKQRWRVVEGGIKAARAALDIERAKRAKGERVPLAPRLTFTAAGEAWWSAIEPRVRPRTQETYAGHLKRLREEFGTIRLSAITPTLVAAYVARLRAAGAKGWTVRGRLQILSSIYGHAVKRLGYVGDNPVGLLDRGERPSTSDAAPWRVLTDEELTRLLDAIPAEHRLVFELMAQTGLRISEALGLTWSSVDFDAATLTVETQRAHRGAAHVATKTQNSERTITLSPELIAKLRQYRLATGRPGGGEFLLRHTGIYRGHHRAPGHAPYSQSLVNKVMQRARERAGLEPVMRGAKVIARAPVPHDLRHTHASRLIAGGFDVAEVAARLGDTIQTVLSTYAHEFDARGRRKDQSERLGEIYGFLGSAMEA
jgi:integrase